MFDYTRSILDKIINDIKKTARVFMLFTQVATIAYLIYSLIAPVGFLSINILLLVLSVAYFVAYLLLTSEKWNETKAQSSKRRKALAKARNIFARSRLVVNFFPMIAVLYGLATASTHATPVSTILSLLPVLGWVLQLIFEILRMIIDKYKSLLEFAFHKDMEGVNKTLNVLNKFIGKPPVETAEIPEKTQELLEAEKERFQKKQAAKRSAKKTAEQEWRSQKREQRAKQKAEHVEARKALALEKKERKAEEKEMKRKEKEQKGKNKHEFSTKDENTKRERD